MEDAIRLLKQAHHASRQHPSLRWASRELVIAYNRTGNKAAVPLIVEMVAIARTSLKPDSIGLANMLWQHGTALLPLQAWQEAEILLRECVTIREKIAPDAWTTFNANSLLGGSLLGQKKYKDAEPQLLKGYEGLKAREKTIPAQLAARLPEALDRLIQFYTETNKPDEAKKWQAERRSCPSWLRRSHRETPADRILCELTSRGSGTTKTNAP